MYTSMYHMESRSWMNDSRMKAAAAERDEDGFKTATQVCFEILNPMPLRCDAKASAGRQCFLCKFETQECAPYNGLAKGCANTGQRGSRLHADPSATEPQLKNRAALQHRCAHQLTTIVTRSTTTYASEKSPASAGVCGMRPISGLTF